MNSQFLSLPYIYLPLSAFRLAHSRLGRGSQLSFPCGPLVAEMRTFRCLLISWGLFLFVCSTEDVLDGLLVSEMAADRPYCLLVDTLHSIAGSCAPPACPRGICHIGPSELYSRICTRINFGFRCLLYYSTNSPLLEAIRGSIITFHSLV